MSAHGRFEMQPWPFAPGFPAGGRMAREELKSSFRAMFSKAQINMRSHL